MSISFKQASAMHIHVYPINQKKNLNHTKKIMKVLICPLPISIVSNTHDTEIRCPVREREPVSLLQDHQTKKGTKEESSTKEVICCDRDIIMSMPSSSPV